MGGGKLGAPVLALAAHVYTHVQYGRVYIFDRFFLQFCRILLTVDKSVVKSVVKIRRQNDLTAGSSHCVSPLPRFVRTASLAW